MSSIFDLTLFCLYVSPNFVLPPVFRLTLFCFYSDIDECKPRPCMNEGVCTDQINAFSCSCAVGYKGSRCETEYSKYLSLIARKPVFGDF